MPENRDSTLSRYPWGRHPLSCPSGTVPDQNTDRGHDKIHSARPLLGTLVGHAQIRENWLPAIPGVPSSAWGTTPRARAIRRMCVFSFVNSFTRVAHNGVVFSIAKGKGCRRRGRSGERMFGFESRKHHARRRKTVEHSAQRCCRSGTVSSILFANVKFVSSDFFRTSFVSRPTRSMK